MGESSNIPKYRHPQSIRRSPFPTKCYVCNKVGHKAKQCRQTKTHYNKPSQRGYSLTNRHSIANAGVVMPSLTHVCSIHKSEAQLRCGCSVPVLGNVCVVYQQNIPTSMGYHSKEVERVLRAVTLFLHKSKRSRRRRLILVRMKHIDLHIMTLIAISLYQILRLVQLTLTHPILRRSR